MQIIENAGIITSISWNTRHWADDPTDRDIRNSQYEFVEINGTMHESLNFAHYILPCEEDGYFIAYTPMFSKMPDEKKSSKVDIIFFVSTDYKQDRNPRKVVGCYLNPLIGRFERRAAHPKYEHYDWGNIKSLVSDIWYFAVPIPMHHIAITRDKLLPEGKQLSQQGFNYIHSDNVLNLLREAARLNTSDKSIHLLYEIYELMLQIRL